MQSRQKADFSARAPFGYAPLRGQLARLHSTYGNQAVLRMLSLMRESSNSIQGRCAGSETRGEDKPGQRLLSPNEENTQPATPVKGADVSGQQEPTPLDNPDAGAPTPNRPTQKVTMSNPVCGTQYGATAKMCYDIPTGWWFKESVSMGPNTCGSFDISQTRSPYQNKGTCITDDILNPGGPPSKRAPCKTVTYQTIFTGPTLDKVEQYKYSNTQVVEVTKDAKGNKVITSSEGASASCDWT